jgi:hypothetical protein
MMLFPTYATENAKKSAVPEIPGLSKPRNINLGLIPPELGHNQQKNSGIFRFKRSMNLKITPLNKEINEKLY